MTHGTIAGMLITDLVQGRQNPWEALYDPSRKTLRAATSFISENVNIASRMLKDLISAGEVESTEHIDPGSGAILREGTSKVAVYRDKAGAFHRLSGVHTSRLHCAVEPE